MAFNCFVFFFLQLVGWVDKVGFLFYLFFFLLLTQTKVALSMPSLFVRVTFY